MPNHTLKEQQSHGTHQRKHSQIRLDTISIQGLTIASYPKSPCIIDFFQKVSEHLAYPD